MLRDANIHLKSCSHTFHCQPRETRARTKLSSIFWSAAMNQPTSYYVVCKSSCLFFSLLSHPDGCFLKQSAGPSGVFLNLARSVTCRPPACKSGWHFFLCVAMICGRKLRRLLTWPFGKGAWQRRGWEKSLELTGKRALEERRIR